MLFRSRPFEGWPPPVAEGQSGRAFRESPPAPSSAQRALESQVVMNPVVQEALRVFRAVLTDIRPARGFSPSASETLSDNASAVRVPHQAAAVPQAQSLWDAQQGSQQEDESRLAWEGRIFELEKQLRRRVLEKEALRRQVTKLGGTPCA